MFGLRYIIHVANWTFTFRITTATFAVHRASVGCGIGCSFSVSTCFMMTFSIMIVVMAVMIVIVICAIVVMPCCLVSMFAVTMVMAIAVPPAGENEESQAKKYGAYPD